MSESALRPATKDDCRRIAALYRIASDGVADYIWQQLAEPGQNLLDVGQKRYEREDSVFSFRNATIVAQNDEVIGMLVAFPMVVDPDYVEEDPVLRPYSVLEEPDSYYICAMAVAESHRGGGIGRYLLELAEEQARERGLAKLSLIVFEENSGAKRLYDRHGFVEKRRETVVPHPLIHHSGDALLMVREI